MIHRFAIIIFSLFVAIQISAKADTYASVGGEQKCDQLIVKNAWRVFSFDLKNLPDQIKANYLLMCLSDQSQVKNSRMRQYNQAVITWLDGERKESLKILINLSASDFHLADLSLALSIKDTQSRLAQLRKLIDRDIQNAEEELAINLPINESNADFIVQTLSSRANKGDPVAAFTVALVYVFPDVRRQNTEKAEFYLALAEETEEPSHMYLLSRIFSEYTEVSNTEKSIKYLLRSAYLGHRLAIKVLGDFFYKGQLASDLNEDVKDAFCKYQELANNTLSQFNITIRCNNH